MKRLLLSGCKNLVPENVKPLVSGWFTPLWLVGVVGCFFDDTGRALVFHHTYRRVPWGVPTGNLLPGEQPAAGLLREVKEESGLQVEILGLHAVTAIEARLEIVMVGRFVGGEFQPSLEVDNYGLFALDALPAAMHPPQVPLLADVWAAWGEQLH